MARCDIQMLDPFAFDGDEADHAFLQFSDQHHMIRNHKIAEETDRRLEAMDNGKPWHRDPARIDMRLRDSDGVIWTRRSNLKERHRDTAGTGQVR